VSHPTSSAVRLKLSLIWLFCMGGLGFIFPFYSLYLRANIGLSGSQIGVIMATLPLVAVGTQAVWGQVADRTGERSRVLALLAMGASAGYVALFAQHSFAGFVVATAALALFSAALIPTSVSVSFAQLHDTTGRAFGRVRVCGTLGFAAAVVSLPWILSLVRSWDAPVSLLRGGDEPGLAVIFLMAAGLLLFVVPFALLLPRTHAATTRAARGEWRLLLRQKAFVRVLAITLLAWAFIQGPMSLFPILVREHGGGVETISRMWMLMLALEVPLVFAFGASVERIGPRGVIAIGLVSAGIRWLVSGLVDDLNIVTAVQLLHGVTVWGLVLLTSLVA
jgi:PPP family 3-phenylpropionic acid transporter